MNALCHFKWMLFTFGKVKVPLIGYVRPKLVALTDEHIIVKIAFCRRTKNHLHSMYFGALAVGADVAAGFHGLYHADKSQLKVSLAFKSFEANFIKRPESDVYFVCDMGSKIKQMIAESNQNKYRVNQPIDVKAFTNYFDSPEEVASFNLVLSIKVV